MPLWAAGMISRLTKDLDEVLGRLAESSGVDSFLRDGNIDIRLTVSGGAIRERARGQSGDSKLRFALRRRTNLCDRLEEIWFAHDGDAEERLER